MAKNTFVIGSRVICALSCGSAKLNILKSGANMYKVDKCGCSGWKIVMVVEPMFK